MLWGKTVDASESEKGELQVAVGDWDCLRDEWAPRAGREGVIGRTTSINGLDKTRPVEVACRHFTRIPVDASGMSEGCDGQPVAGEIDRL